MPKNRKQSRSPNEQVYWRANQFPSARIGTDIFSGQPKPQDADNQPGLPEDEQQKLDYLKNRFKSTDTSGVDGPTGPCGE